MITLLFNTLHTPLRPSNHVPSEYTTPTQDLHTVQVRGPLAGGVRVTEVCCFSSGCLVSTSLVTLIVR